MKRARANEMTAEVRKMVAFRHAAEQRGHYSPLGRLSWLRTDHGLIRFPAVNGECSGPDLATVNKEAVIESVGGDPGLVEYMDDEKAPYLVVLGQWLGLPPLRVNTSKPCPKCRHACDVCDGSGKKLCELCGGQAWVPGPWLPCPGPGCVRDTGGFEKGHIKEGCITCRGAGQVPEQKTCPMCDGTKQMTCTRCRGTGKYSTGRVNGSVDWDVSPKCKACAGTTFVGEWKRQDVNIFTNATLVVPRTAKTGPKGYLVLGPILEFCIVDYEGTRTRFFDVAADSAGDLLVLLVPRSPLQKPQKAYLVGGIVQERVLDKRVSA